MMSSQIEWDEAMLSSKQSPFKAYIYRQESSNAKEQVDAEQMTLTPEFFYSTSQDSTTAERKSHLQNKVPEIVSNLMVNGALPGWAADAIHTSPSSADTLLDINIPKLSGVLHQRAWKLLNESKADDEEAARLLRFCVDLTPDDSVAYYNLACAYARLGQVQESLKALQESVRLSGDGEKELQSIKNDADLQNLRETEDFKAAFPQFCPPPPPPPAPCQYLEGLRTLHEAGFKDDEVNILLLEEYNGDVSLILQDQLQSCLF